MRRDWSCPACINSRDGTLGNRPLLLAPCQVPSLPTGHQRLSELCPAVTLMTNIFGGVVEPTLALQQAVLVWTDEATSKAQDALLAMGEPRFGDAQELWAASEHPELLTSRQRVMTNGKPKPCPGAVAAPALRGEHSGAAGAGLGGCSSNPAITACSEANETDRIINAIKLS